MKTESNLLGGESTVYSFTDVDGREVHFTPSRIITEKDNSSRGRFITLDKVSMVRKRRPRSPPSFHLEWKFMSVVSVVLAVLSGLNLASNGVEGNLPLIAGVVVFTLLSVFFYYKSAQSKNDAESGIENQLFINVRTCDGGVGFTIEESEVNRVMTELQDQLGSEVPIKDER